MRLNFDYYHNLEQVDLYLCNPDGRELFPLPAKSRNLTLRFNDLSALTFEVNSKITLSDGTVVELEAYDYIKTKRLIFATNIGWFHITSVDEHDDGLVKYKSVTTESYQSVLKNKGFISEERVYCFYNPNDPYDDRYVSTNDESIPSVLGQWSKQLGVKQDLGQGLADPATAYNDWTVTYVNSNLTYTGAGSKCRTFKENTTYGYDWIVNDVEEAFEVVVLFDFIYKTIHVMTPDEAAQKVNVIYTFNNFMKSVNVTENSDDIVTVLNCNGDNCDITAVNPTGTNYICDFSYFMDKVNHRWMSSALIEKLEQWKTDCDAKKDDYTGLIEDIRALYQTATEKETLLKEMSLSLADLRTAQNKRSVLGNGTAGALCGIVTAETVNSYRTTANGVETVIGGTSIKEDTDYHTTQFTGSKTLTAYQFSPTYNTQTRQWEWTNAGASRSGKADEIIADNLSDSNTSGVSYWYFSDDASGTSYCKLKSTVTVNKDTTTSTYYCGGFDRYIAYVYPSFVGSIPRRDELPVGDTTTLTIEDLISDVQNTHTSWDDLKVKYEIADDATGTTIYTDKLSEWINLREQHVKELNIDLYGYGFTLSGYQCDYKKTVDTVDGLIYVTMGTGGKLLPTDDSVYGKINDKNALISDISNRLNILSYFASTPTLLRELNCYWIEGDYTNDNIAVLEETTPEETIDLSNELMDAGYIELSKVCQPRFSFSLESIDATKQYEFRNQMRLLELGKIITIEKEEGLWYYPALLEISMNLDNSEEFTMTFANAMRLDDWGYTYADLISDASSTSRKVSANWQDILAYSKEREEISSLIKDPLDTTLRASFANMVNQEFTVDKNGILGRKKVSETSDEFEDEQVRLINNLLIFTDDNWETAKTALGKIYYTDDKGTQVTSYGLIAETIIGSLIMGERLKIKNKDSTVTIGAEGVIIKNENTGEDVFRATNNGELFVKNYTTSDETNSLANTLRQEFTVADGQLSSTISKTYATQSALESAVTTLDSKIEQTAESITLSVSKTYATQSALDGLSSDLSDLGSTVNGIGTRLTEAEASIAVNSEQIKLKASKTMVVDGLESVETVLSSEIKQKADSISATVSNGTLSKASSFGWTLTSDGFKLLSSDEEGVTTTVMDVSSSSAKFAGEIEAGRGRLYSGIKIGDGGNGVIENFSTVQSSSNGVNFRYGNNGGCVSIYNDRGGSNVGISSDYVFIDANKTGYLSGDWLLDNDVAITSDANVKNSICVLTQKYESMFDSLRPVTYKYNYGTSGRSHVGFIAQDVHSAIIKSGLSTNDFAGFVEYSTREEDNERRLGLRYGEFIALNTWQIQQLKTRIAELESTIAKPQGERL